MAHFLEESSPFDAVSALLDRTTQSCRFQFFSTEQARRISVVRVSRYDAFDELGRPTANGLHDAKMGVTQVGGAVAICPTCQMTTAQGCPGHLGHIQLHTEVYNPFLLVSLSKLLQLICTHCGKFRCADAVTNKYKQIFACLARGQSPPEDHSEALGKSSYRLEGELEGGWNDDGNDTTLDMVFEDHVSGKRRRMTLPHRTLDAHREMAATLRRDCVTAAKESSAKRKKEIREIVETFPCIKNEDAYPSYWLEQWRIYLKEFVESSKRAKKCASCRETATKFKKDANSRIFIVDKDLRLFCTPSKIREYIKKVWEMEGEVMEFLYPGAKDARDQFFFVEVLLVTPNCFRPIVGGGGSFVLATETRNLMRVLDANDKLAETLKDKEVDPNAVEPNRIDGVAHGYVNLQEAVNCYYDSSKGATKAEKMLKGIRQLLERKEGLFRSKMMGKRVNFAARSVISPDNNLDGNEIGLPPHIVKTLAYPEPVTMHNFARMRKLVENGTEVYPGASYVLELSAVGENRCIDLNFMNRQKRQALAQKLLVGLESGNPPFVVYRNLVNGDPVLMNRQPTLHKPGIMAHKVRVLHGEKTIRMHYVNCNTYNADFDGDEMNCHSPQDPISRIEALSIALTDNQYLVPTSGKPLRGLIQDHVVGGVFLCARDTFLTQEEAAHLLYKGLGAIMEGKKPKHMVEMPTYCENMTDAEIYRPPANPKKQFRFVWETPAIMKPQRWTGKQMLTMVLKSLLRVHGWDQCSLFHTGKAKTPGDIWNGALDGNKEEEKIAIRGTELLCGVLDKSQFGSAPNGLVHLCYEIFGPAFASLTLSVFAKTFTAYLQMTGFTCAMSDFLVNEKSEVVRAGLIFDTHAAGAQVIDQFAKDQEMNMDISDMNDDPDDITWKLKRILAQNPKSVDLLDGKMLGKLREYWGQTIDSCLPSGQRISFPKNCFATMIQTGAKGSKINHSQISCLMGQQELEGRRVPFLATRRSLPSFAPFDYGPRAGGYITDRFLTGIRPQEYFFHCMAGREGLVDTAVKTSRSGYLQRCLVKHLETLVVGYDSTVRDVSDDSVVQFCYGEDGLEVVKTPYLSQFEVARQNPSRGSDEAMDALRKSTVDMTGAAKEYRDILTYAYGKLNDPRGRGRKKIITRLKVLRDSCKSYPNLYNQLDQIREELKSDLEANQERWKHTVECFLDPPASLFSPGLFFGSTSEKFGAELEKYLATAPMSDKERVGFQNRMHLRFQKALCAPGEAVGVIAAQGMGEPSTQMTLNTFHLAGHGGANVTLGIPRLREIVQTASKKIMTPFMKVFFRQTPEGETGSEKVYAYATEVSKKYCRTLLKDLVKEKTVVEEMRDGKAGRVRTYNITIVFEDFKVVKKKLPYVRRQVINETMSLGGGSFVHKLSREVKKLIAVAKASSEGGIDKSAPSKARACQDVANVAPHNAGDDDDGDGDVAPPPAKKRKLANVRRTGRRAGVGSDVDSASSEDDVTDAESGEEEIKQEKKEDVKREKKEEVKSEEEDELEEACVKQEEEEDDEDGEGFVRSHTLTGNIFFAKVVVSIKDSPAKMLLSEVVSSLLESIYVQDPVAKGLTTLNVREDKGDVFIETEGINMQAFWNLPGGCVWAERMYTNCIASMMSNYGVEACRQSIVAEIRNVFGHYGIEVNYRHLYLVADYMTHHGGYRACNRLGMQQAASPFLQMSFETSMQFCTTAAIEGLSDTFKSPTGSIIIGGAPNLGSNCFSVHCDLTQQTKAAQRIFKFS